ncbi:L-lactate permease [Staphylococcus aureus]
MPGDVSVLGVSQSATLTLAIINFIIPFLLLLLMVLEVLKKHYQQFSVVSITYTLTQGLLTVFSGPELADIIPPLLTMLALAVFSKKFQPKHIYHAC